jgi:hypothetical protein
LSHPSRLVVPLVAFVGAAPAAADEPRPPDPIWFRFDPTPPSSLRTGRPDAEVEVESVQDPTVPTSAPACTCDRPELTCAVDTTEGRVHAVWRARTVLDWPDQWGVVASCTAGGVAMPVMVGFAAPTPAWWWRGRELVVPVPWGVSIQRFMGDLPRGMHPTPDAEAAASRLLLEAVTRDRSDPHARRGTSRPAVVRCVVDGDELVVRVRVPPGAESQTLWCTDTDDGPITVRLLPYGSRR